VTTDNEFVRAVREALRAQATRLALDPASISSPSPAAITGRTANGALVRLDVSTYEAAELSR
jgi:hypothetical protein